MLHLPSATAFALLMAGLFVLAFNQRFWLTAAGLFWTGRAADAAFLAALGLLLLLAHAVLILLVPGRLPMQVAAALLFPLAAMAAYCADSFGVVIDSNMVRNLGETDHREVMGLLSPRLLVYAVALGVVPVFLVARCRMPPAPWRRQLRERAAFIAAALVLGATVSLPFISRFRLSPEQRHLAYLSVPGAAIVSAGEYFRSDRAPPVHGRAETAATLHGRQADAKPLMVFLVIGETARHANFQLGGYPRPTNPALAGLANLYYFTEATACATSTALSVPCMLSPLGRDGFSMAAYRAVPGVLEELAAAGVQVAWRSNNTSRFDPGTGVRRIAPDDDVRAALCNAESCLDAILLEGLEPKPAPGRQDRLEVFHQMGSHGPAYYLRYPAHEEYFRPACRRRDLPACSAEELRNAYDNTIRYTDRVLARMIEVLTRASADYDTALLYVSDHGESLGEKGLFLHSAPYRYAPEEQKRIPFMLWLSDGYQRRARIDPACLRGRLGKPVSHDNVYHSLLGMMEASHPRYQPMLDALSACRNGGTPARHAAR